MKKEDTNRLWIALNDEDAVVGLDPLLCVMHSMIGLRVINDGAFEVQKLAVARNYRRRHISGVLWNHLETCGKEICSSRRGISDNSFLGPLRICLSTLSLLDVAESFYTSKGFVLVRKDHFSGYDLDVFEKVISSPVSSTNTCYGFKKSNPSSVFDRK